MRNDSVMPDQFSYTGCIDACGKAGEWNRAEWLLYEMRDAGVQVRLGRLWSLFATIFLLGVVIRMCDAGMRTPGFARSLIMSFSRYSCKMDAKFCLNHVNIVERVLFRPAHVVSFTNTHARQQSASSLPPFSAKYIRLHRGNQRVRQSKKMAGGLGVASTNESGGRRDHNGHLERCDGCVSL